MPTFFCLILLLLLLVVAAVAIVVAIVIVVLGGAVSLGYISRFWSQLNMIINYLVERGNLLAQLPSEPEYN